MALPNVHALDLESIARDRMVRGEPLVFMVLSSSVSGPQMLPLLDHVIGRAAPGDASFDHEHLLGASGASGAAKLGERKEEAEAAGDDHALPVSGSAAPAVTATPRGFVGVPSSELARMHIAVAYDRPSGTIRARALASDGFGLVAEGGTLRPVAQGDSVPLPNPALLLVRGLTLEIQFFTIAQKPTCL